MLPLLPMTVCLGPSHHASLCWRCEANETEGMNGNAENRLRFADGASGFTI
jgi:hypothetical protein